jgi:lipopolysaccharide export system permease protein
VILSRYITKEVVLTLLAVTLVLLLAFLSQQLVRYLNYAAIGKIPTNVLLALVGFEIPYILSFLLPLGLYLGLLLTYGRLYADNEMSILQMYGYGNRRILLLTIAIALLVAGLVLYLNLSINPMVSAKRQQLMVSDEAALHLVETLIPGRFQASPDGKHVMYVGSLSLDRKRAENVFLAQMKKTTENSTKQSAAANTDKKDQDGGRDADTPETQNSWTLVLANEGYQEKGPHANDQLFVTEDGYRYEGTPGQNDYKIIQFKKYAVRIPQGDARAVNQENEALTTAKLWHDYAMPRRAAELQWRFSPAFVTLLLALLTVPLSARLPRQSRYFSLLPAILIYIIYINLLYIARHWVEQQTVSITMGVWWVHGVMFLFVLLFFFFSGRHWA